MKKNYLIGLLVLNFYCISKTYSQKTINLAPTNIVSLNAKDFSAIEIINNLPDSNILGYIPAEVMNDRKIIKSSMAITPWLQNFVNKQFFANSSSNKKLLWVIDDFSMGTDSSREQVYSYLKLKADIYSGTNENYQLINTFDSTWIITGSDVDFGKMIAQSFINLYKNSVELRNGISNIRFQQLAGKLTGTKDDIVNKIKLTKSLPILKTSDYTTGIYTSFEEFKNNAPSITSFYADVNKKNNQVELYQIMADSSSQRIAQAWGMSISNELYFYTDGQLYPIEKSGNTFYMAKYLEPRTRKNQAIYWRQIIGARQGDTNPYNDDHELLKKVPTAENISLEATHLDFDKNDFIY
jgi:hypothetical protein